MKVRHVVPNILLVLTGSLAIVSAGCVRKELEPTPPEPVRPAPVLRAQAQYQPVKGAEQGARETSLTTQALPQLRSHLDVRTIQIRAGAPVSLPVEFEGVFELRAGSVATIEDGKPHRHERGEMWHVNKGSATLQAFGEFAVVRAIYLVPGEK